MSRTLSEAVRELCLSFPATAEKISHGMPGFKVAGKTFAYFVLNHHGDGRVALWLATPPADQHAFVDLNPGAYFVPPYVGPKGWLGMELNKGLAWADVVDRVRAAWVHNATPKMISELPDFVNVAPPDVEMSAEDIDPLLGAHPRKLLARLAELCQRLPEAASARESGGAVWRAGKKTFVRAIHRQGRIKLLFWVGIEQQGLFTEDPRYAIPMYWGSSGWIELDVQDAIHWEEIESLLEGSYRHFAFKRMLRALDG